MKHTVRTTLFWLGLGVSVQRVLQLATFLCIGHALGVERLGIYAEGLALGGLLAVLAGTGVRNVLARAVSQTPDAARSLVLAAVRARLLLGAVLGGITIGVAFGAAREPWFWTLCVLQVLPCAFDLKTLLDAAGRTRAEVLLDTTVALLQLALVLAWIEAGGDDLVVLAAIALCSKCLYALGAVLAISRLPNRSTVPFLTSLRHGLGVGIGQTPHEVMVVADVWIVAWCMGSEAAGLYAVAARLGAAALVPSLQVTRLLMPHMLRASHAGNPGRTLATALRATLLVTLPVLAGGAVVAEGLCGLSGPQFRDASLPLVLLLGAGCLQHLAWQCSNALLAEGRDAAYARGLGWPSVLQLLGLAAAAIAMTSLAAPMPVEPWHAAAVASACAVLAHAIYLLHGLRATRELRQQPLWHRALPGLLVAAATAVGAAVPRCCGDGAMVVVLQVLAGGIAFGASMWLVELRGRVARLGDGLAQASGFGS
ncbi:MAG TPA: oligosaccharide flippase family protein [Planctomycetota bacterium]